MKEEREGGKSGEQESSRTERQIARKGDPTRLGLSAWTGQRREKFERGDGIGIGGPKGHKGRLGARLDSAAGVVNPCVGRFKDS
jgi:hypothetical protein